MVLPSRDGLAHLVDRLLDDLVAGGLGDDLQPVQDGHAAADHGAQGPGELGHGDLADQRSRRWGRSGASGRSVFFPRQLRSTVPMANMTPKNGRDDDQDVL